ncbi:hypothetical protein FQZ97_1064990 [compost metagenome]
MGGALGEAFVVAGDHNALPAPLDQHLRRSQNVPGRIKCDRHVIDLQRHAEIERLEAPGAILAIAHLHDGDRIGRRQNRAVPAARVVGMAMGDDGAVARRRRIDIGVDRPDMQVPVKDRTGHGTS